MINGRRIGIVLPAYNAAATLSRTVAELDRNVIDEIVLVDVQSAAAAANPASEVSDSARADG